MTATSRRLPIPPFDRNGRLVLVSKALRAFAWGLDAVALGLYLGALGLDPAQVGLILAAALFGTMLLTLVIALFGDRLGRRRLLVAGGLLMLLAALVPVVHGNPIALALIGLTGMLAVTANESTGLHSVDQAILPQTVPDRFRTAAFGTYSLLAFGAAALGAASIGPLVALGERVGLSGADAYAPAFFVYAICGGLSAFAAAGLDAHAEVEPAPSQPATAPAASPPVPHRWLPIGPSRGIVGRLAALFALDSFAGGLAVQSYLAFWFSTRFGLEPATIGALFFAGGLLSAASFPLAVRLAGRIGLIRTMVVTHIPASILLIAMAVLPDTAAALAGALYLARALLSSMDVPTRQSYVMAVVEPSERTSTAGVTSLARSAAQTAGPLVGGALLAPIGIGLPLIACGSLKITYDVLLYALFRARPAPEERLREAEAAVVGRG